MDSGRAIALSIEPARRSATRGDLMTMVRPDLILQDLKVAFRSLWRTKGLAITVILTLALGIGANAAIFSLVRGVLLRPLVNRDENRLIYIRQSAPGAATGKHELFRAGNSGPQRQPEDDQCDRRLFSNRFHHGGTGRSARSAGRCGWRLVLRRHGTCVRCWAGCSTRTTMVRMPRVRAC